MDGPRRFAISRPATPNPLSTWNPGNRDADGFLDICHMYERMDGCDLFGISGLSPWSVVTFRQQDLRYPKLRNVEMMALGSVATCPLWQMTHNPLGISRIRVLERISFARPTPDPRFCDQIRSTAHNLSRSNGPEWLVISQFANSHFSLLTFTPCESRKCRDLATCLFEPETRSLLPLKEFSLVEEKFVNLLKIWKNFTSSLFSVAIFDQFERFPKCVKRFFFLQVSFTNLNKCSEFFKSYRLLQLFFMNLWWFLKFVQESLLFLPSRSSLPSRVSSPWNFQA